MPVSALAAKHSLSRRVFGTVFSVAFIGIAVFAIAGTVFLHANLARSTKNELYDEVEIVATALNSAEDDVAMLKNMKFDSKRVTLIDVGGDVIYDSEESESLMENHENRPEIEEARAEGHGSAERSSSTLGEVMLYEAVALDNGQVVRLAEAQEGLIAILASFVAPLILIAVIVLVVSFFAARRESRAIIAPLLDVDLDHPIRNAENAYTEMIPMLERIESQRQELKRQVRVLADNDRMRREFTANITHELKTPLTAISGYAELIASGMVADEADQRDFAHRIHKEAGRLTALVNDILTLSSLDEAERGDAEVTSSVLGSREPVDLPRTLDTVYHRLETVADVNGIVLAVKSEPAIVNGVPRLLDELVYNLASNAIRYNKPNGSVTMRCGVRDGKPFISVEDTGICIAP